MKITQATITNFRVLSDIDIHFHPHFTLIVGVNGAGKSTLLDAIRICASRILPGITKAKAKAQSFGSGDIAQDLPFLDVELGLDIGGQNFRYTRREWKEKHAQDKDGNVDRIRRTILETTRPRERLRNLLREVLESQRVSDSDTYWPSVDAFRKRAVANSGSPNCIFFSTYRSVVSDAVAGKALAAGGEAAAYAEALTSRPLYLAQFADWMRAQDNLASERPLSARHLKVLQTAVMRFLPGYENLRAGGDGEPRLAIDKKGVTLDVRQLSDGERGVLSLVLDIARRLSQGNPTLKDPLRQGEAVVLIDELDLHLHPKWQRTIVQGLTKVFPKCQFIATTHSPQIVAAVEPEQVLLLKDGNVIVPDRTFGLDSNWILRHLMEADERPPDADKRVREVEELIRSHRFNEARVSIASAKKRGYELPEWSVFDARMSRLEVLAK